MAHKKAWLRKRVKLDGMWRVATPVITKSGTLSATRVQIDGENVELPGIFILEWYQDGKRRYRPLGTDAHKAHCELQHQIRKLADKAEGQDVDPLMDECYGASRYR
jgi:hypothetical protein